MKEILTNKYEFDILSIILWFDSVMHLPDGLVRKIDRMSMVCSFETRAPFLDHILVEFILKLPRKPKIEGFNKKHILKRTRLPIPRRDTVCRKKAEMNFILLKLPVACTTGSFCRC